MAGTVHLIYLGTAVSFACVAAVHDLLMRKIPNWITVTGIIVGVLMHLVFEGFVQAGVSILAGMVCGMLFLLFYLAGGMGAGDVKLIAAVGCLVGVSSIRDVVLASVFLGAILALGLAARRGKVTVPIQNAIALIGHHAKNGLVEHLDTNLTRSDTLRFPYALPIAFGCTVVFCIAVLGGGTQ